MIADGTTLGECDVCGQERIVEVIDVTSFGGGEETVAVALCDPQCPRDGEDVE